MPNFNKVILMGRLTAAPELKQTPSGVSSTSFTLAVDRRYSKDGEKVTDFIAIQAWRQTAEFICKYFDKGSSILVCGSLETRSWEDQQGNKRYTTYVLAAEAEFCGTKNSSEVNSPSEHKNAAQVKSQAYKQTILEPADDDDDIPF
jgi:single-strand DNA-binding protein